MNSPRQSPMPVEWLTPLDGPDATPLQRSEPEPFDEYFVDRLHARRFERGKILHEQGLQWDSSLTHEDMEAYVHYAKRCREFDQLLSLWDISRLVGQVGALCQLQARHQANSLSTQAKSKSSTTE